MNGVTEKAEPQQTHIVQDLKHERPLISCRFDPLGQFVFAGAEDSRIWRWDLAEGKKTELKGHESWVRGMAFLPDGQTMISAGYDGKILWWPVTDEKPLPIRSIDAHDGWVRAVAVSGDGLLIASAGNDNLVKIWNAETGELVQQMAGHSSHVYNVAFHPQGKALVSGDLKGNLIHWEVAGGKKQRELSVAALHKYDTGFRADIGGIRSMLFSQDGATLAISGITNVTNAFAGVGNALVVLVDWEKGKEKQQYFPKAKPRGVAWGVAIHPDGFTIAAAGGGGGGFLYFWKGEQKEEFHQLKLPNTARDLALHPDHLQLATAHYDGHLRISKMRPKAKSSS